MESLWQRYLEAQALYEAWPSELSAARAVKAYEAWSREYCPRLSARLTESLRRNYRTDLKKHAA